jgi:hypothetical protein
MTPRERRKLADHLAEYLFRVLGNPRRVAAKHRAAYYSDALADPKGEVEGAGLSQAPMADHIAAELGRYVRANKPKARRT